MVSVDYYLSKRGNTEIICSIFVTPENNTISDMLFGFNNFKENVCRSLSFYKIRQLLQLEGALVKRFSVVYLLMVQHC